MTKKKTTKKAKTPTKRAPALTDEALDKLASAIVKSADYDLWKGFYGGDPEDPDIAAETRKELRDVARKHIKGGA